jgi:hypothetical protein
LAHGSWVEGCVVWQVFVGNLPVTVKKAHLITLFKPAGEIGTRPKPAFIDRLEPHVAGVA